MVVAFSGVVVSHSVFDVACPVVTVSQSAFELLPRPVVKFEALLKETLAVCDVTHRKKQPSSPSITCQ